MGVANAGLCGWFAESQRNNNNPFGGYVTKSKGTCKFVDRSMNAEQNTDSYKLTTCSTQCKKPQKPKQGGSRRPSGGSRRPSGGNPGGSRRPPSGSRGGNSGPFRGGK